MFTDRTQLRYSQFSPELILAPIASCTEAKYRSIVKTQMEHTRRIVADGREVPLETVLADLMNRTDLKLTTKRTSRSALLWYVHDCLVMARTSDQAAHYAKLLEQLKEWVPEGRHQRSRCKGIPADDLLRLDQCLMDRAARGSDVSGDAAAWFRATLFVGLRPSEWIGASWRVDSSELVVINGKVKVCSPAHMRRKEHSSSWIVSPREPTRLVRVEDTQEIAALRDHMERYSQHVPISNRSDRAHPEAQRAHAVHYDAVRAAISRACKDLWGKPKYSLYSARQQFQANSLAMFGPVLTAERMGHCSSQSPSCDHYAKRHSAHASAKARGALRRALKVSFKRRDSDGTDPDLDLDLDLDLDPELDFAERPRF